MVYYLIMFVSKLRMMKHCYLIIALLISFLTFNGCEDVLDCIINVRPELHNKTLARATVDEFYSETITAEIKNEPNDNGYDYYFSISGNLPEGIDVIYDYRDVIIEGVPLESGRFTFRVFLDVEAIDNYYYDDFGNRRYNDPLCSDNTSRTYTLVVN